MTEREAALLALLRRALPFVDHARSDLEMALLRSPRNPTIRGLHDEARTLYDDLQTALTAAETAPLKKGDEHAED